FYENQDPEQADMNLRGKFFTDHDGHISFRSVKPAGYPIPIDGPTGELLRAQGRHNMRPAHLHFLASKDGFKTLISQIYVADDKFIDSDVQFGINPGFRFASSGYTPTLSINRVFPSFAATSSRSGPSLSDFTGNSVSAWRTSR